MSPAPPRFSLNRLLQRLRRQPDAATVDATGAAAEAERRQLARARLSGDWHWETDEQLRVCWVSADLGSHRKLGLQPEELLGRTHDSVPFYRPPEDGWGAFRQRMAQRKPLREVEIEVRRPGRTSVWVALSGRARFGADGRFLGYEGVGRDVTEQHLAFARLRESEARYAVMAGLSADWYWETDPDHRVTELGPTARQALGPLADQVLGRTRWEIHPDGASDNDWARHFADLDARRPFHHFEYVVRLPGQGVRWFSVSGQPRLDERGVFAGYHGVGRDVTLRKRAEKVLLTRNAELERLVAGRTAELEQSNRDLEAFSRQLAHELRTPLGHVVGFADLLRTRAWDRLEEEEREWLGLQATSARAMSHTVGALLELARSSSAALLREQVDLSALARAVVDELPWLERTAPVDWIIASGLHSHCSAALMRVVLTNLLGNAAKFTRDTAQPQVRFGLCDEGFYVQDNGAGFDGARASSLFQPFVRLHGNETFQGTGLGLSIVRRIVERHGGTVSAEGRAGAGARFVFTLGDEADIGGETTDDAGAAAA